MDNNQKPIDSLAPFIAAGWWTAPLSSKTITRKGKDKSFRAPRNWNSFKDTFNETPSPVGALMTGEQSKVVVLDCDSTAITNLVMPLLDSIYPNYEGITHSIGKIDKAGDPIEAISVFFRYSSDYPPTLNQGPMGLEWFNGGSARMVFLPTVGNKTKQPWVKVPELLMCPEPILELIKTLSVRRTAVLANSNYNPQNSTNLAPLIVQELGTETMDSVLFTIITPRVFKATTACLFPQDIPDGQRSNYMSRVSAIVAADSSVSKDLYVDFMNYLNGECPNPIEADQLDREIIGPMVNGTAQIDGKPIWQYNKHWEKDRMTVVSRMGDSVEYFYDSLTRSMYEINHSRGTVSTFTQKEIVNIVASMKSKKVSHVSYKFMAALPNFEASMMPSKPFGLVGKYEFNIFQPTSFLSIVNDPELYMPTPMSEKAEIRFEEFLESLIPNISDREYLINHLFTKLTTFHYSAVVYYLVGAPGSGKGTFVRVLARLIGKSYISQNLSDNEITEKYNEWLHNKYFVHFDELHKSLNRFELGAVNERIKRLTGGETFALRKMRSDSDPDVPMLATFVFTQNGNNMQFDESDRRYMWMDTPNSLSDELSEFWDNITDEKMQGVAHYIAMVGRKLSHSEYKQPPFSEAKLEQMIDKLPTIHRIFYFIKELRYKELHYMFKENGISDNEFLQGQLKNRLVITTIIDLIEEMHPTYRNVQDQVIAMAKQMLPKQPSHPFSTGNVRYFVCEGFNEYQPEYSDDSGDVEGIDIPLPQID